MKHFLEDAKSIAKHYQHLIGMPIDGKHIIKHVLAFPIEQYQIELFTNAFIQTQNADLALSASVLPHNLVTVVVADYDALTVVLPYKSLDLFLTERGLQKVYNSDGTLGGRP